jgi:exopolyphosphatase/guanosine-5'-triphosphate,3'-diphosphate pyrophosphatase
LKVSVIDLGFNSLKLVAYDIRQDNTFFAYDQKSIPARLGEGLNETGFLGNEQMRRTIDGLKYLKEMNELYSIRHCLPIATSAVREAANRESFLQLVYKETGFKFRVLSGKEEALLSFSGGAMSLAKPNALFFDIGGGSLELVYSVNFRPRKIFSLPLGGLRLTQLYAEHDGSFKEKSLAKMEERVWELLPGKREINLEEDTELVGVGGNLRGLARWNQKIEDYPLNKIHNYTMKLQEIEMMREELMFLKTREIADIDVIGKDRAETIAAGSLVIELLMKKLGFRRLVVSTHGLRDGVLATFLENPLKYHRGKAQLSRKGLRQAKVHSTVARVTGQLESFGLIEEKEKELIAFGFRYAMSESFCARPESFFYEFMDMDSILSHRDQLMTALALAHLRKQRSEEWLYSRFKSMLKPKSKDTIERIAAIINLLEIIVRMDAKVRLSLV